MNSIVKWLEKLETALVTVTLTGMTIAVFLQVFFRFAAGFDVYLEGKGIEAAFLRSISGWFHYASLNVLTWTEELARYFMIWTVFVGAALGARLGVHVGIEAVVALFPAKITRAAYLLAGVISMIFCLFVCYYGLNMVRNIAEWGQVSPAMAIPMTWVYAAVPVGCLLMAVHFIQAAIEKFVKFAPKAISEGNDA
jgi:C4-dicarboxylate transporter DctQ subunit